MEENISPGTSDKHADVPPAGPLVENTEKFLTMIFINTYLQ